MATGLCVVWDWFDVCLVSGFLFWFLDYVLLKWTLWNVIRFDIRFDTLDYSAAICLWMYMRNKSLAHRPSFLIIVMPTPLRYIAIAPPAQRLWERTSFGNRQWQTSCWTVTACLITDVMLLACSSCGWFELCVKYVLMHVWGSRVLFQIVVSRSMMAVMG